MSEAWSFVDALYGWQLMDRPIDRLIAQDEAFDVLDVWMTEAAREDDWARYNNMAQAWSLLVMLDDK
jgi:hypothetical protein